MKFSYFNKDLIYSLFATIALISMLEVVGAQVRTSTNYQLQSDSINAGGGYSESASYQQESTVGEIGTGVSDSSTYSLRAGYQQMQEVFISLASTGDVIMSPDLPGLTGGTSNGSSTFTVITDSPSGYQLLIEAANNPAMQSGANSIADYVPVGVSDFTFTVGAGEAYFGFTPQGNDIVQAFKDDGADCNIDSGDTALACWDGLSVAPKTIAEGIGANHPDGATTTVNFRVGLGTNPGVIAGVYTATTTVTALPL
jgi:hypothetical protein